MDRVKYIEPDMLTVASLPVFVYDHDFRMWQPASTEQMGFAKNIIVSGDATIVFWLDGTKTVVRCSAEDDYSVYNAFCAALAIKIYGSNSRLKKEIKAITHVQQSKKQKPEPPTEFLVGDYVSMKKKECMTDGAWPRKVLAVDKEDCTVLLSDFGGTWWESSALELAQAPSGNGRFEIGQKVKTRPDLVLGKWYNGLAWTVAKAERIDAVGGVAVVKERDDRDNSYVLEGCEGEGSWYSFDMLEPVEDGNVDKHEGAGVD